MGGIQRTETLREAITAMRGEMKLVSQKLDSLAEDIVEIRKAHGAHGNRIGSLEKRLWFFSGSAAVLLPAAKMFAKQFLGVAS